MTTSTISSNQIMSGSLSTTDDIILNSSYNSYKDDYRLTGITVGLPINVKLISSDFDPDLQVVNASTDEVIYDVNSNLYYGATGLTFTPQSGINYLLRATSDWSNYGTGAYTISTTSTPTISLNQTISGSLSTTDDEHPLSSTYSVFRKDDYFLTEITVGSPVNVILNSSDFDTYLEVVNSSTGEIIASNDNFNETTNSGLNFTPQSGISYLLRAVSSYSGKTGAYTISASTYKPTIINVSTSDATAAETNAGQTANPGQFVITRTGMTNNDLNVYYTVGGTATKGTDYNNISGSITIPAGATRATIPINVINNSIPETSETVILNLSTNNAYAIGSNNRAVINIVDNETETIINSSVNRVTTTLDENNGINDLSLREAIIHANGSAGDDTIILEGGKTYKLTRTGFGEDKSATGDLDILSSGGKLTILVSGTGQATINGGDIDRIFDIQNNASLTLTNLVMTGGDAGFDDNGGGINNKGTLTITNSTISGNTAFRGGGLYNKNQLTIRNSTISGNDANHGGGINNGYIDIESGDVTLINTTVSSNKYVGILSYSGSINLKNTTVTGNSADGSRGGGMYIWGETHPILNFSNSIICGNELYDLDFCSGTLNSEGNNLIGNGLYQHTSPLSRDVFPDVSHPENHLDASDQLGANAKLGPLQNNGGLTKTHALLAGSPAINKGNSTLTIDARGYNRNSKPDIGAYEYHGILKGTASKNILLGSPQADIIDGLGGHDTLNGGGAADSLTGGVGNDILTGGKGNDQFIYSTNTTFTQSKIGLDTITDFVIAQADKIVLDKTTFPKISSIAGSGFSQKNEFAKVTSNTAATTSAADIVYNSATGGLFYNENGTATGFGTGGQFLTLTNKPALTATQFIIQA